MGDFVVGEGDDVIGEGGGIGAFVCDGNEGVGFGFVEGGGDGAEIGPVGGLVDGVGGGAVGKPEVEVCAVVGDGCGSACDGGDVVGGEG